MWTKVHPELGKAIAEKQKFYNEQVRNLYIFFEKIFGETNTSILAFQPKKKFAHL